MTLCKAFLLLLLVYGNLSSEGFKYSSAKKFTTDASPWSTYGSISQDPVDVHLNDFTYKNSPLMSARDFETVGRKQVVFSKFDSIANITKSKNKKVDEDNRKLSENSFEEFKARSSESEDKHFSALSFLAYNDNPMVYNTVSSVEYKGQERNDLTYEDDDNFDQDEDDYDVAGKDLSDHGRNGNAMIDKSTVQQKLTRIPKRIMYIHRIKVPVMQQTKEERPRQPRFFKSIFKKIKALFSSKKNNSSHSSSKKESNIKESSSGNFVDKTPKQEGDTSKLNNEGPTKDQKSKENFRSIHENPIAQSEEETKYLERMDKNSNQLFPNEETYSYDETVSEGKEEKHSNEHNTRADDYGRDYADEEEKSLNEEMSSDKAEYPNEEDYPSKDSYQDEVEAANEGVSSDKAEYPNEVEYANDDSYQDEVAIPSNHYPAEERSAVEDESTNRENLNEDFNNVENNGDFLDKSDYPRVDDYSDEVNIPSDEYKVEGDDENDPGTEGGISSGMEEYPNETEYPQRDVHRDDIQDEIDYPTGEENPEGEDYPAEEEYSAQSNHAEDYVKEDYSNEALYSGAEDYQSNPEENYDANDVIIQSNEYQVGEDKSAKENGAVESLSEIKNTYETPTPGMIYSGRGRYGVRDDFPGNKDQKDRKEEYINAEEFLREKLMHLKNEEKFLDGLLDGSHGQTHMSDNQYPVNYANPSWPYAFLGTRNEQPIPYAWPRPKPQNLPGYNGGVLPNYSFSQGSLPVYYPNQWQPLLYPTPIIGG